MPKGVDVLLKRMSAVSRSREGVAPTEAGRQCTLTTLHYLQRVPLLPEVQSGKTSNCRCPTA